MRRVGAVSIRNSQRKFQIDEAVLEKATRDALTVLKCDEFDVGIWLTTDPTIRKLNAQYRGKKKSTDARGGAFYLGSGCQSRRRAM